MEKSPIFKGLPKKKQHKEIRIAVCKAIDSFEVGQKFNGKMIQKKAAEFYPGIKKNLLGNNYALYANVSQRRMRLYRPRQFNLSETSEGGNK